MTGVERNRKYLARLRQRAAAPAARVLRPQEAEYERIEAARQRAELRLPAAPVCSFCGKIAERVEVMVAGWSRPPVPISATNV